MRKSFFECWITEGHALKRWSHSPCRSSVCPCVRVSVCQCVSVSVCQCVSVSVCQSPHGPTPPAVCCVCVSALAYTIAY